MTASNQITIAHKSTKTTKVENALDLSLTISIIISCVLTAAVLVLFIHWLVLWASNTGWVAGRCMIEDPKPEQHIDGSASVFYKLAWSTDLGSCESTKRSDCGTYPEAETWSQAHHGTLCYISANKNCRTASYEYQHPDYYRNKIWYCWVLLLLPFTLSGYWTWYMVDLLLSNKDKLD